MSQAIERPSKGAAGAEDVSPKLTKHQAERNAIERQIEKLNFKTALKSAKVLFREEASPENRELLERLHALRINELIRSGMVAPAKEVAAKLMELGVTNSKVIVDLVPNLFKLGLHDFANRLQSGLAAPDKAAAIAVRLADTMVLDPDPSQSISSSPSLVLETALVRDALEMIAAGRVDDAFAKLQGIPRSSPCADWRLFARGLVAFQRGEFQVADANWSRLDPTRAAQRIVVQLRKLQPGAIGSVELVDTSIIENVACGATVSHSLRTLQTAIEERNWKAALAQLPQLKSPLDAIDSTMSTRVTAIILQALEEASSDYDSESALKLARGFTQVLTPLDIDPHWDRFWAILWRAGSDEQQVRHWEKYLNQVDEIQMDEESRRIIRGIVWHEIGKCRSYLARPESTSRRTRIGKTNRHYIAATTALETCIDLIPTRKSAFKHLIELHQEAGQFARADKVARTAVDAFPDDEFFLNAVVDYAKNNDKARSIVDCLEQVRVRRPLDTKIQKNLVWARAAQARQLALKAKWDVGRVHLNKIDSLEAILGKSHEVCLAKAAFEWKANNPAEAERHFNEALGMFQDPAAVRLAMCLTSIRFQLPASEQARFDQLWSRSLKGPMSAESAGIIARSLSEWIKTHGITPKHRHYVVEAHQYLKDARKLNFTQEDAESIADFLDCSEPTEATKNSIVTELFPKFENSPKLLVFRAEHCVFVSRGVPDFKLAENLLNRAIQRLNQDPNSDREIKERVGVLQEHLIVLKRIADMMPFGFPFQRMFGQQEMGEMPDLTDFLRDIL